MSDYSFFKFTLFYAPDTSVKAGKLSKSI